MTLNWSYPNLTIISYTNNYDTGMGFQLSAYDSTNVPSITPPPPLFFYKFRHNTLYMVLTNWLFTWVPHADRDIEDSVLEVVVLKVTGTFTNPARRCWIILAL